MTVTWMLYAIGVAAVLSIAAELTARAARSARIPTRWVWLGAMLVSALWPVVTAVMRAASDDAGAEGAAGAAGDAGGITRLPAVVVGAAGTIESAAARTGAADLVLHAWVAISLVLLVRLAIGVIVLRRHREAWTSATIDGVTVRLTRDHGPAVVGIAPGEIVLPAWVRTLDPASRAMVLAHEREHLAARDPALLYVAALLRAALPWNPLLWWQSGRLALAIETDCDLRVLARGADRARYARLLVDIASRQSGLLLAPSLSAHAAHLERRITAMRTRPSARLTLRAALFAAAGTLAAGVAVAAPLPDATIATTVASLPDEIVAPEIPPSADHRAAPRVSMHDDAPLAGQSAPRSVRPVISDTIPLLEKDVDKPVGPVPGNAAPIYPAELRTAGVGGEVIVQFVVNTDSTMAPATFKVLKSSHGLFTESVHDALLRMRFVPAMKDGRPVRQIVQMPFVFSVTGPRPESP